MYTYTPTLLTWDENKKGTLEAGQVRRLHHHGQRSVDPSAGEAAADESVADLHRR